MFKTKDGIIDDIFNIHICEGDLSLPHTHEFLEIAYVFEGKAVHILNGDERLISKGDYLILDFDAEHSYKKKDCRELQIINCIFHPEFIDKVLKNCTNFSEVVNNYMLKYSNSITNISPANYIFHDDDNSIYELLKRMLWEYSEKKSGYYEIIRCRLIEIIISTMRKSTPPTPVYQDKICEYIIKYMSENISEKNILGKVSEKLNFSTSYLSRKFKEEMQISFSEYLQKIRIEESCRLLANTNKKITEIAYLSGYSDMKFFNSIFKRHLGITPREFRKHL